MRKIILHNCLMIFLGALCLVGSTSADEKIISKTSTAIFAGGCFWCMEPPFDALSGVISTTSGYIGGQVKNPSYKEVSNGNTGHFEAVLVAYDPAKVTYQQLLEVFWRNIDPFDENGQFCDKGEQYQGAIFYQDENQRQLAEASKIEAQKKLPSQIVTTIRPANEFFPAEDYHQDYYQKNPTSYKFYRFSCGRDRRLNEIWEN